MRKVTMISIIVCSRNKNISEELVNNIKRSIGAVFEIVCIDNSEHSYSMCSAYNEGVRRAKGEYLCFMHEDIEFLSKGWGRICENEFRNEDVWMLGVVGSTYFDAGTRYWCYSGCEVGHAWTNGKKLTFNNNTETQDVVAVDGFWMMLRKETLLNKLKWDESLYQDFDMYDMDISMQVLLAGGRIRIVNGIDINHKSAGNYSPTFYANLLKFHDKWDRFFPVASFAINQEKLNSIQKIKLGRDVIKLQELYYLEQSRLFRLLMRLFKIVQNLKIGKL